MRQGNTPSRIRAKVAGQCEWLWVGPHGQLTHGSALAVRMSSDEACRRILQYLNDYPGWQFEEVVQP